MPSSVEAAVAGSLPAVLQNCGRTAALQNGDSARTTLTSRSGLQKADAQPNKLIGGPRRGRSPTYGSSKLSAGLGHLGCTSDGMSMVVHTPSPQAESATSLSIGSRLPSQQARFDTGIRRHLPFASGTPPLPHSGKSLVARHLQTSPRCESYRA